MSVIETNLNRPLVSIVMPSYNAERFVEAAILSVAMQTVSDWELIVVDDCSTDSTCSIVQRLAAQDHRIKLVRNPKNLGVAQTRNHGFELCAGKYVALLDSDDIWLPRKLEDQVMLAEKTNADLIYCSYQIIDENGQAICEDFIVPEQTNFNDSLAKSVISCSTVLFKREVTEKYRFNKDFYHEDLVLWLELLRDGYQARGVTEVSAQYRVMKGSRASNKLKSAYNRWRIYREFLHLSVLKSTAIFGKYAILGLMKYKTK